MSKADSIKQQIDILPPAMLREVERLINQMKKKSKAGGKAHTSLSELSALAIEDDLPADMAKQHDHYLYGVPKK